MANPVGRPTKYDPAMCEKVVEEMKTGATREEMAGFLGIHVDTFYEWLDRYQDFSDAVSLGDQYAKLWWMKKGRESLEKRVFREHLYATNMANRFGWRSRVEHSGDEKNPVRVITVSKMDVCEAEETRTARNQAA